MVVTPVLKRKKKPKERGFWPKKKPAKNPFAGKGNQRRSGECNKRTLESGKGKDTKRGEKRFKY